MSRTTPSVRFRSRALPDRLSAVSAFGLVTAAAEEERHPQSKLKIAKVRLQLRAFVIEPRGRIRSRAIHRDCRSRYCPGTAIIPGRVKHSSESSPAPTRSLALSNRPSYRQTRVPSRLKISSRTRPERRRRSPEDKSTLFGSPPRLELHILKHALRAFTRPPRR